MDERRISLWTKIRAAACAVVPALVLLHCSDCSRRGDNLDLVGTRPEAKPPEPVEIVETERSPDLHTSSFVVDLIHDLVFRYRRDGWTLDTPQADVTSAKLRKGGVDLLFSSLPMIPGKQPSEALDEALSDMKRIAASANGAVEIVASMEDARKTHARGAVPVMLLIEGADALEGNLDRIPELARQGVGAVGLVAGKGNRFADVAVAPKDDGGLTAEGVELLSACRDAGVLVDLTHASSDAFWDAFIEQSGAVVVTHTAARALRDHPRNLDDLQILALARGGGVMGLVFNPDFLRPGENIEASLNDVVAHIMHVKAIGAIGALALGTDYGGVRPPSGLEDVSRLPVLTEAMRSQGLSDAEITGVLGGNAVRLIEDVERKHGEMAVSDEVLRPIKIECDSIIGDHEGSAESACDGFLLGSEIRLTPAAKQKVRLREISLTPVRIELFGEPGTPWQVEGQNLDGKVLLNRAVALDDSGMGSVALPSHSGLTRLFCSPTRPSALREVVVWGR